MSLIPKELLGLLPQCAKDMRTMVELLTEVRDLLKEQSGTTVVNNVSMLDKRAHHDTVASQPIEGVS